MRQITASKRQLACAFDLNKCIGCFPRLEQGVALPLRPEFGTQPNVYYVPPLSPAPLRKEALGHLTRDPAEIVWG